MMKSFRYYLVVLVLLALSGCRTMKVEEERFNLEYPEPDRMGVYHKVNKGETIWRIAKTYEVSIDDIISANNIPNAAQVEVNQLIFIPGAYAVKEISIGTEDKDKDFIWPVEGKVITYFRERHGDKVSKGIDIETRAGEDVHAARSGRVVFADALPGYGNVVILDHQDGYYSVYANNARILTSLGETVSREKAIAQVGLSDNNLAFLHFQIRKDSHEDNPMYYLP